MATLICHERWCSQRVFSVLHESLTFLHIWWAETWTAIGSRLCSKMSWNIEMIFPLEQRASVFKELEYKDSIFIHSKGQEYLMSLIIKKMSSSGTKNRQAFDP